MRSIHFRLSYAAGQLPIKREIRPSNSPQQNRPYHEEDTKRLMWSTCLVTELRKSRDGLIRSVVLRTPNGNHINRAIQCIYPLEVRMDDPEEVAIEDLGREPEAEADPVPLEPASFDPDADPVDGDVKPSSKGSGGRMLGTE